MRETKHFASHLKLIPLHTELGSCLYVYKSLQKRSKACDRCVGSLEI